MKIIGLYNWHDGGYCVLEDGIVKEHIEFERYTRLKESGGDSLEYFEKIYGKENNLNIEEVDYIVTPSPITNLEKGGADSFNTFEKISKEKIVEYSHHLCHASHAFYSSNFNESLILTIDSAGLEKNGKAVSTCAYIGTDKNIDKIFEIENNKISLGSLWGRFTRFIFKLSTGYPRGHQAGSVMAMAALGDPDKYYSEFMSLATDKFDQVRYQPPGYKRGVYVPPEEDVIHPFLDKYRKITEDKDTGDQEKYNMAASLQKVTEDILFNIISQILDMADKKNIKLNNVCLAGGVSLNSVLTGKILEKFKGRIENVFIPPVPYDGGLTIGACQYHWHAVLGNERIRENFVSPYLGESYKKSDVTDALNKNLKNIKITENFTIDMCTDLLIDNKIVSVFQGRSESGRRALGNRSIIANPGSEKMKDMINEKVKHRQWYRPFAPSVLEDHGEEWFQNYFPSPYMGFVFKFKSEKLGKAPAIEHLDGTARIQTVNKSQNEKYYNLINSFYEKSKIPMVLNTSFNDREPIVENPEDSIKCFLGTDIDYLYFADHEILVEKLK